MEIIETNRLILRKPKLSDAVSLLPLLSDKDVQEYTPGLYCDTIPKVISYLQIVHRYDYSRDLCFVIEKKHSKKIIGIIEGYSITDNIFPISYACLPSERGKGYITEAVKVFVNYLYFNCNFDFALFCIDRKNSASQRVMKKLNIELLDSNNSYNSFSVSLTEELPF